MKNLSDFLTREGLPPGDIEKLNLKNTQILDFVDHLPKEEFTLKEWAQYCADNPQYLTVTDTKTVTDMLISQDKTINYVDEEALVKKHGISYTTRIGQCHRYNHPSGYNQTKIIKIRNN
jgi:hypothetical protein